MLTYDMSSIMVTCNKRVIFISIQLYSFQKKFFLCTVKYIWNTWSVEISAQAR